MPTAPTAPVGTNTDQLATTAFVQNAILANPTSPEGRLTLTSGVPVQVINMSAATTLYYTPFHGNKIPIYDGTNMAMTEFNEMSCLLSDITKNPSDTHVGKLYDWFVWNDAGTLRLGHGPEWTNVSTRSAGTALVMIKGFNTNAVSIITGLRHSAGRMSARRTAARSTISSSGSMAPPIFRPSFMCGMRLTG